MEAKFNPRRSREALRILRDSGVRGVAQRAVRIAYHRLGAKDLEAKLASSAGVNPATP